MGPDLAALLEALPPGKTLWMRVLGRSMAPLLRSGDSVQVLRCRPDALRRGDVAVVRMPGGTHVVHLVVSVMPLRTSPWFGQEDPPGSALLGRVVALRRGSRRWPLPAPVARPLLLLGRAQWQRSRGKLWVRTVRAGLRGLEGSRAGAWWHKARRGPLRVRPLSEADAPAWTWLVGDVTGAPPAQGPVGCVGAFDEAGRLWGAMRKSAAGELEGPWMRSGVQQDDLRRRLEEAAARLPAGVR